MLVLRLFWACCQATSQKSYDIFQRNTETGEEDHDSAGGMKLHRRIAMMHVREMEQTNVELRKDRDVETLSTMTIAINCLLDEESFIQ
jgi:hypothetical protein